MAMDLAYVLRGYRLTNTARVIYGLLDGLSQASARNGKPYTYISRASIAERVGVCEKTVRTCLKSLKSCGLIAEKRVGRGLNNHIFVFSPKQPQEEKQKKVETADHSIYHSRTVKNAVLYTNTKKVITNTIDKSIYPANEDIAPTAQIKNSVSSRKGKQTNKRPRVNIEEKQKAKKRYKEFLIRKWRIEEDKFSLFDDIDEYKAIEKIIELISNVMSSKGKIMVNGSLILPSQWWYVVKEISVRTIQELLFKLESARNVKNYRAYLLAAIYNSALEETLQKPWYNTAY